MKRSFVDPRSADAIDRQIAKILKGLGDPEPPLILDDVRELLRLDRHYYSSSDDSAIREFVSKLKVGGKQVIERPQLLIEAIKKWDIKALYVLDRQRILIDSSQPKLKWRWNEAHEVTHSVVEWHEPLLHGDTVYSLNPVCHQQIEAEANYGAGRLLFMQEKFVELARSSGRLRRAPVRAVLRRRGRPAKSGAGPLLPPAVAGLL